MKTAVFFEYDLEPTLIDSLVVALNYKDRANRMWTFNEVPKEAAAVTMLCAVIIWASVDE